MGYISVKILNIEVPNDFRVYIKPDSGDNKPYPIDSSSGGWTVYGPSAGYSGGTTEIWLYGINEEYTYDFQYGTTYWIKIEEIDYPERYVIKNIRIFDAIAYQGGPIPTVTPTVTRTPSGPIPSITRTSSPTPTPPVTRSITPTVTKTPSVTPTIGTSRTPSVSTSQPAIISEIYFSSFDDNVANVGITNSAGRTFSLIFNYHINANCDNVYSNGQDSNQSTTYLFVSTNSGSTWSEIASITSEVSGDNYPVGQSDSQDLYGTFTLTGITDVAGIRVRGDYECSWALDNRGGTADVTISGATVNSGVVVVICDNSFYTGCLTTPYLYCTGLPTTPSVTPSRTPSLTRTPSVTPEVIKILAYNDSGDYTNITDIWVGNLPIIEILPAYSSFPLYPGDSTMGRSQSGTGNRTVVVYLAGTAPAAKYMTVTDSVGTVHCQSVEPGATEVTFLNVYVNQTGILDPTGISGENVGACIIFYSGGACPSPLPVTPSITPTITRTPSITSTPGLSPTRTPSVTPTSFGYYISIYTCNGTICGTYISNGWIQNNTYLTPNRWYKFDNDYVYYISSTAPLGGDSTSLSGSGYDNCSEACAGVFS